MAITLLNQTGHVAAFEVYKGGLVFATLPDLQPGAELVLQPQSALYEISAQTVLDGDYLTSVPVAFEDSQNVCLTAQVAQQLTEQPYLFLLLPDAPSELRQLQLAKTCKPDVLFRLSREGQVLQTVLVTAATSPVNLALNDVYGFIVVVDGITVAAQTSSNQDATVTVMARKSGPDGEFFELQIS